MGDPLYLTPARREADNLGAAVARVGRSFQVIRLDQELEENEPQRVMVVFDWESREAFDGFLADGTIRATMQSSGTVGRLEFTFVRRLAALPS